MATAVGGISYLATAQTGRTPVKMTSGASSTKPKTLADLPAMVEAYGQSRLAQRSSSAAGGRALSNVGSGESGFNLQEEDFTPNSRSDDREPAYSPGGDFIAFASNGIDANKDGLLDSNALSAGGKYHIWVMNRNATGPNGFRKRLVRQVTGLDNDPVSKSSNQRRPTWSPEGQLAYINGDGGQSELYVTSPLADTNGNDSDGIQVAPASRRTFFNPGANVTLLSPAWSPNGQSIVFAANRDLDGNGADSDGSFNLFSINPTGDEDTIVRLTGGSTDTTPGTSSTAVVNDHNPAFAVNSNVIYYSSNRTRNGVLNVRRIWRTFADGTGKVQVTDPLQRRNGRAADNDDYPASSLRANVQQESISFQTTTSIDGSDVRERGGENDFNIWSLPLSSDFPVPFMETEPRIFVSNFSGDKLENLNPLNGQENETFQGTFGVKNPEGVVVQGQYVYVSNRGNNQITRFDQETGVPAPSQGVGSSFTAIGSVPSPAGLLIRGGFIYAAAATGPVSIYRFNFDGGTAGRTPGSAEFSFGERTDADKVDGTEGITFSNDGRYIYTSNFSKNKVNVYLTSTGQFVKTFVAPNAGSTEANGPKLDGPTDLTFGPDLNNDKFPDLFVNSSNSDDVLAFAGPNPNDINAMVGSGSDQAPGSFISAVVDDEDGTRTNLNAPEGIDIITRDDGVVQIFVSSFHNLGNASGAPGTGDHINRYALRPGSLTATSFPSGFGNPSGATNDATYLTIQGAKGLGYFDFNQLARQSLASQTGQPAPTPIPTPRTTPLENSGAAKVVTNILSSPDNYAASGIAPKSGTDNVGQDKAPDIEPNYSRLSTTPVAAANLVFASTRRFAPVPSSNLPNANGSAPTPSNPFGTYDIWGTSTEDTTPPILTPQASGSQLIPVVAPGPQSPFPAPRTAETGLKAGGDITVAAVISELESGIDDSPGSNAVTAVFYRAGTEQFETAVRNVNEGIPVSIKIETRPRIEKVVRLQPYDDGPISKGGHEEQSGAVAGDGLYYCVSTIDGVKAKTPTTPGDYYIDIFAYDREDNQFNYDNIWGFSTQIFQKRASTSNLFVSDYTTGQLFPSQLTDNDFVSDNRFNNETSVESYFLTNNGGAPTDGTQSSIPTTFTNVDVWRILSRGPVPSTTIDAYKPRVTQQIDPRDPTRIFTEKTRNVAVADSFIVWAAPFAANSLVSPGTIRDATTQTNLTNFLEAGGRLFVTGRDVAFALSNDDSSTNNFLGNELGATLSGEVATNNIDLVGGKGNGFIAFDRDYPDTYYNLQIADRVRTDATKDDLYSDGALTQQPSIDFGGGNSRSNGSGVQIDTITSTGEGTTPVYAIGGATVGQKVERTRNNGLKSRVVFFSFGLEGVNRRYRKATPGLPLTALDTRARIAAGLGRYFKTNRVGGIVINDKTNLPIPNFLVRVTGGGDTFLARTDDRGNYELSGLPEGVYFAEPAFLLDGRLVDRDTPGAQTDPGGFFGGTPARVDVAGGNLGIANLRPIPVTPGSISGRIVTSQGTPTDFTDDVLDEKAVGLTVLLRSTKPTSLTKNGGRYAQLTKTNFNGSFTFSNVPAGLELEVVFNPRKAEAAVPATNTTPAKPAVVGDIPAESGLEANYSGPKTDVGRRVIPDSRHLEPVVAPIGNTFVLNDPDPSKYDDPDTGPPAGSADSDKPADSGIPLVIPEGASISGVITLNGAVFVKGATVNLYKVNGAKRDFITSKPTSVTGTYSFNDLVPGIYLVSVTADIGDDGLEITKDYPQLTLENKDLTANIKLFLAKVSGLVNLNGKRQSGVTVQLLDPNGNAIMRTNSDGSEVPLVRTTTTDSRGGINYDLSLVPPGKYMVRASFGGAMGSADITVGSKDVVVPTINLIPQKLSGVVNLRVDGQSKGGISGVEVELLDANGKSFDPKVTTTSGSGGAYNFELISAGTYKVRASYKGDIETSGSFTLKSGIDPKPTLTINLQTVLVTVLNTQGNAPERLVSVTISKGGNELQTRLTNTSGQVKFVEIPAGTYEVTATKGELGRTNSNVVVTEGKALAINLQLLISGGEGTTYGPNQTFQISFPYATDNIAQTVRINEAFIGPSRNYKIYSFNAAGQKNNIAVDPSNGEFGEDLVRIADGNLRLKRGVGYILQTFNTPVSTRKPSENQALQPFDGTSFSIPLTWNNSYLSQTGAPDNRNNGYNLIGFPFDPARYRSVSFNKAVVKYGSKEYKSVDEAAAAGIISNRIFTMNAQGDLVPTMETTLRPFVGYYVRILRNDQPIELRLQNPTSASN